MDHRVEADQVLALDVSNVHLHAIGLRGLGAEGAGGEQVGVDSENLVPRLLQRRDQHRADVAVVTGYEYAQGNLLLISVDRLLPGGPKSGPRTTRRLVETTPQLLRHLRIQRSPRTR